MMRKFQHIAILSICFLGLGLSCKDSGSESSEQESTPRIVKTTKLVSPARNSKFKIGETITFGFESSEKIDSIALEYQGISTTFDTTSFTWKPGTAKTGNQKIRLTTYFGSSTETHYPRFVFLSDTEPEMLSYEVINKYPHDTKAYTQGLFFKDDTLVESTGHRGESYLAKVNLETAEKYKTIPLDSKYFGEGSCYWNNEYIQITWMGQTGFTYDNNFNKLRTFHYTHEGWGATIWGDTLYVSDGTNVIHKIDPRDFSEIGKLEVYDHEGKISDLNELEMIDGLLYANIYQEDYLAVIDPISGKLLKLIDLAGLLTPLEARRAEVLNGIAYNETNDKLYVTGKYWPSIFEIKLIPNK